MLNLVCSGCGCCDVGQSVVRTVLHFMHYKVTNAAHLDCLSLRSLLITVVVVLQRSLLHHLTAYPIIWEPFRRQRRYIPFNPETKQSKVYACCHWHLGTAL